MRVLLLGSGGREHALAWKIAKSSMLDALFIAPGNAGTKDFGKNVSIQPTDFKAIEEFVLAEKIDMVVEVQKTHWCLVYMIIFWRMKNWQK